MKKLFLLGIVLVLALTACGSKEEAPAYSSEYEQACFDIGGLMGRDGCVTQTQQVVDAPDSEVISEPVAEDPVFAPVDDCGKRAEALEFPQDLVDFVCSGTYGSGAGQQLPSGTKVVFGTITIDNATAVWILRNFVVPNYANYAFEFGGTEKNIFEAPFLNGKKECFNQETGERTELCKVCFETESPGCELDIEFFSTN